MGKKSIVVEVMKKRLAPYGFQYADYEGYRWRFSRELDGLIQSVVIQKSYHGNDYTLEMDNGYWFGRSREITDDPNCKLDFLPFYNEEEQIAVLNKLLDLVEQYGLKKLEEKAEESRAKIKEMEEWLYPTPEMYKKLYEENSKLTQNFMEQYYTDKLSEEDMLLLLKRELEKIKGEPYEDVQDKLIELASVYGNMFIKKVGGCWKYIERDGLSGVDITLYHWCDILQELVKIWQREDAELILNYYNDNCNGIIRWVRSCRKLHGEDWQPSSSYAKWKVPLM
ncbi:hypothetical protein [Lacrimispora xylanisolvens]|uniref:hypothetical protein n=1 Tax=Lacrimispora xylanisolvens TaxID=384636 RepID=UPI0024029571